MQIPEDIQKQVKEVFAPIDRKVVIKVFTSQENCDFCKDTLALSESVAELSDFTEVVHYDLDKNPEMKKQYQITHTPAILIDLPEKTNPIRFYGIPAGYEFSAFIETIRFVGTGKVDLPDQVIARAKEIKAPKNVKVFVTTQCPYCSGAVLTGFQLALVNPEFITTEMVEASEFPDLSNQYKVRAVPKAVMNETTSFEGAMPPDMYLEKLIEA